jgi:hypothetical protein
MTPCLLDVVILAMGRCARLPLVMRNSRDVLGALGGLDPDTL